jgi:hypothetical protein
MTAPHVIRLRAPWDCQPLERGALSAEAAPGVRCSRRFNAPSNLDAEERVWLLCDAVEHRARFTINGHSLGMVEGPQAQPRLDITGHLQPHNQLVVEIELAVDDVTPTEIGPLGLPGGLGEMRLEIARHAPDWQIEKFDPR